MDPVSPNTLLSQLVPRFSGTLMLRAPDESFAIDDAIVRGAVPVMVTEEAGLLIVRVGMLKHISTFDVVV
jgi:hypothetical protein